MCSLFLILYIPFASKPVHIDDANFLMLAEGAARDPWRPHNILVNWSGKTEPAFDILANPPGIAWYLASVRNSPEWMLHLTMLPWLVLGGWGCWLLGSEFANGAGYLSCMYILTCPVVVISAHALTPDLPVFACMTAGIAGFLAFPRFQWAFALLAGGAALFRYSGCTAIPLLVLAGWTRYGSRGARMALISAIPILLLVLHDIHAYGKIHLFVMFASQNDGQKKTFSDAMHICVAGIAMLGGAGVLPVLIWRSETIVGVVVGAILGFNVAWLSGLNLVQTVPTVLSISAGVGALTLSIVPRVRDPILSAWALGGTAFFYFVAFAATRYWAAFIPGVALLAIRNAQHSQRWIMAGIAINTVVSFGIAVDDQQFAFAHKDAAGKVAAMGIGTFSGHWGWQHYLDKAGWTPVERGGNPGPLHAFASFGDSQLPDATACLELIERFPMPDRWPGPRSYSWRNRAFYHGGGRGSYAPWTFSNEPYDVISVYRRCDPKSEQINALEAEE
ncbi:MAG: hypothetical protein NT138_08535 [Planctomycetales bacterium]|nr:hypothetical protein [Planctomycetales bacterium]